MTKRIRRAGALLTAAPWLIAQAALGAGCAAEPDANKVGAGSGAGVTVSNGYGMGDGFKGYWYTYKDSGASRIKPECGEGGTAACFSMSANKICVSGTAGQVQMMMYSTYWGAGVGWNLNQEMVPPNPLQPASLKDKKTVTVKLDMKVEAPTRIKFKVAGETADYCASLRPGLNTIPLDTITKECWTPGGDPIAADASVEALQFQVLTNDGADTPFDFCVNNLSIK